MKKSICNMLCLSAIAMLAHSSFAASIEQVIVRQQWPWSTDIHVEYKIKDVTHPTDIHVQAFNGNEPLDSACLVPAMSGRRHGISKDGIGTISELPTNCKNEPSIGVEVSSAAYFDLYS